MNPMTDSQDHLDQSFEDVGKRLAVLLAVADISDEEKEAWTALVPSMSLEQLDRFARALEANIPGIVTPEIERLKQAINDV